MTATTKRKKPYVRFASKKDTPEKRAQAIKEFATFVDKVSIKREICKFNDAGIFSDDEAALLTDSVEQGNHKEVKHYLEVAKLQIKTIMDESKKEYSHLIL